MKKFYCESCKEWHLIGKCKKCKKSMFDCECDNVKSFNIEKNPILKLAVARCQQKNIKLKYILSNDSIDTKNKKSDENLLILLDVASSIIDRLPMNYTSKKAKEQFNIYCQETRENKDD